MEKALLHLDKHDIRLLHPKMQLARAREGQCLVREGVPPPGLFIIREGSVVVKRRINGFSATVNTLQQHELFGEGAFIDPARPASASVAAAEHCELLVFTPARLQPLFEEHPGLFGRFFHSIALTLSRRLRAFNEQAGGVKRDRFGDLPNWEII